MAGLVAVTGGGGFIATELIHQLLVRGCSRIGLGPRLLCRGRRWRRRGGCGTQPGFPTYLLAPPSRRCAPHLLPLQAKGYNVRATVRNRDDASRVGHLTRLAEALPGALPAPELLAVMELIGRCLQGQSRFRIDRPP